MVVEEGIGLGKKKASVSESYIYRIGRDQMYDQMYGKTNRNRILGFYAFLCEINFHSMPIKDKRSTSRKTYLYISVHPSCDQHHI